MRVVICLESDGRNESIERDCDILDAYEQSKTFCPENERKDFGGVGVGERVESDAIETWKSAILFFGLWGGHGLAIEYEKEWNGS